MTKREVQAYDATVERMGEAVNIKNVTNKKAKSTIGVISNAGAPPFDGFFDIISFFI